MNVNSANNTRSDFLTKDYTIKNRPNNTTSAIKSNITQNELLNERISHDNETSCDFVNNMYQDVIDIKNSSYNSVSDDNIARIDTTVDKSKQYTEYINNNFQGKEKDDYLEVLSKAVSYSENEIADSVSKGFSEFLNLNEVDTKNISNNVISIISDKINGNISIDTIGSNLSMDYDGLKTLSSAIKGFSKNINVDISVGLFDVAGRTASLDLAMMKTNFIVEKTNLPDKLKMQLLTSVTDKVIEQNKNTLINQTILINAQDIIALERIGALRKFSGKNNYNVESNNIKNNIDNIYKEFNNIKFDKNHFKTQLLDLLKNINTSYSEQVNYNKDVDYQSGTNISMGIEKSQTTFSDKLSSDWNNFIDNTNIKDDKSTYYLPASNHAVIDTVV